MGDSCQGHLKTAEGPEVTVYIENHDESRMTCRHPHVNPGEIFSCYTYEASADDPTSFKCKVSKKRKNAPSELILKPPHEVKKGEMWGRWMGAEEGQMRGKCVTDGLLHTVATCATLMGSDYHCASG